MKNLSLTYYKQQIFQKYFFVTVCTALFLTAAILQILDLFVSGTKVSLSIKVIIFFLYVFLFIYSLLLLVTSEGKWLKSIVIFIWILILSSSIGGLLRATGFNFRGLKQPIFHLISKPFLLTANPKKYDTLTGDLYISFSNIDELSRLLKKVSEKHLKFYIELPMSAIFNRSGTSVDCKITAICNDQKKTITTSISRKVKRIKIPLDSDFSEELLNTKNLILNFQVRANYINLLARDIGYPANNRNDILYINGQKTNIPCDGIVFIRLKFIDFQGNPQAVFY